MTITKVEAVQVGASSIAVTWTADDAASQFQVRREIQGGGFALIAASLPVNVREFLDVDLGAAVIGDTIQYRVEDFGEVPVVDSNILTLEALEPAVAPVNALASTIRYTTLAEVKARLGITTTDKDARLTQTIIATEVQIDQFMGRSFIPSEVPIPIREAATNAAQAVYKKGDSPTGTMAGVDEMFGALDVSEIVRRELGTRNALLLGYQVSWGTG